MAHDGHDHHDHTHDHSHHHEPTHHAHRHEAPTSVSAFVVTCSDTRTTKTDAGGPLVKRLFERAGHTVVGECIVADDVTEIERALEQALNTGARAIVFTGGTGVGRRDVTIETLEAKFVKHLPGFGELFRSLSYEQIGSAAMLSRATAGVVAGAIVFALPGSPNAVSLGVERLILPEVGHLVRELVK